MKISNYIGFSLIILGVIIFLLGVSTYFWEPVSAHVLYKNEYRTVQNGYNGLQGFHSHPYKGGDPLLWQSIGYSYIVNGQEYTSKLIGFKLPFNNQLPKFGPGKTAYYFPGFPSLSVLLRGPDYRIYGAFISIGLSILLIRNWVKSCLEQYA
ncbi:hypothetical protein P886_1171 [Alteromonadaceae bacterium 2753L.S.0a.02]|nr:hypothetical protein P886_1171 [Alteromonadaceae bacterium 2753L.S.0a.02]